MSTKVGVAGLGHWGPNLARNFAELAELTWLCDSDPEKRELFARLAEHWKASAAEVERVIAAKLARSSGERSNCLTK